MKVLNTIAMTMLNGGKTDSYAMGLDYDELLLKGLDYDELMLMGLDDDEFLLG